MIRASTSWIDLEFKSGFLQFSQPNLTRSDSKLSLWQMLFLQRTYFKQNLIITYILLFFNYQEPIYLETKQNFEFAVRLLAVY